MSLELSQDIHYESKGFMPATSVTDFHPWPQGHSGAARWRTCVQAKVFSIPIDLEWQPRGPATRRKSLRLLKRRMETSLGDLPFDDFYHVDRRTIREAVQGNTQRVPRMARPGHADKWLVFPENIGPNVAIDESSLSQRRAVHLLDQPRPSLREGCLIAIGEGRSPRTWRRPGNANDESKEN